MPDHDATSHSVQPDAGGEVTATAWSDAEVIGLGTIDSTNRYALDAARAGRRGGFVVVCDHQRAGRGRRGRTWVEPPGGSLLCSVVFRPDPDLDPDQWGLLTVVVAAAAIDAIAALTGVTAAIKWPNDIVIDERKVAGILAEIASPDPDVEPIVVVGIGINLAFPPGWLDADRGDDGTPLAARATTLEDATGVHLERDTVLAALLAGLDRRSGHRPTGAIVPLALAEARERSATIGRVVRIEDGARIRVGTATGISDTGRLEVEIDGERIVVDAADVVHLR